jgi:hypothetical protein
MCARYADGLRDVIAAGHATPFFKREGRLAEAGILRRQAKVRLGSELPDSRADCAGDSADGVSP